MFRMYSRKHVVSVEKKDDMASEGAEITKAVFNGLGQVTKTITDSVDIASVADEVKNALRDFYTLAVVAVVFLIVFVAGMAVAMGVTAAATWRTQECVCPGVSSVTSATIKR